MSKKRFMDGRENRIAPVRSFSSFLKIVLIGAMAMIGIIAIALNFVSIVPALRIGDGAGKIVAVIPLPDGRFIHHYMHTINLSPVDEYFRVEGRVLRLYELRYDTTSVGMPSDSELGYKLENGRFILQMDRKFDRIPLRVSIKPEHGIIAGDAYYPFSNWAGPMKPLVLTGGKTVIIKSKEAKP